MSNYSPNEERRLIQVHSLTSNLYCVGTDNKNRYVIATQSLALRKVLRNVPGLPIVYIARSVVLLEAPSDKTVLKKKEVGLATHTFEI